MTLRYALSGRWSLEEDKVRSAVRLKGGPRRLLLGQLVMPVGLAAMAAVVWHSGVAPLAVDAFVGFVLLYSMAPAAGVASIMREEGAL